MIVENKSVLVPELSAFLTQENGSLVYSKGVTVESVFPCESSLLHFYMNSVSIGETEWNVL